LIVLDAAALVDVLLELPRGAWVAERIAEEPVLAAPHLIDLEVASAVRNRVLTRDIPATRGAAALHDLESLTIRRYPATRLLERIWQLRDVVTPYDAAYLALAEALVARLVTTDDRLGRTTGHHARIESYPG
jgi:predicted nucleic acid-binding protein